MSATADHPIHVVAGLIRDVRGRVLLARRTRDRDLAGLWEFPGGKVEAGERPQQGLARELREELGIDAEAGALLIAVPQRMPHKRILLEVYEVAGWRGKPRGLDGQALAWVPIAQLPRYAMPPADRTTKCRDLRQVRADHRISRDRGVFRSPAAPLAGAAQKAREDPGRRRTSRGC